ncbi:MULTISPECIES: hypothetical protein [Streptomyces]|uniref:hypothetical protein n=1 Tax=Streptomyces TaxID=1883 RepID=UPI0016735144|nr:MULTISPECIES: hypothetical protein [Streptomyces]MBK3520569.1 hypothetical protein [Streptomyces sp. MBT70]GGR92127.1 hypothetical protein GCM10010236_53420 [Streptomyces eurythermus]
MSAGRAATPCFVVGRLPRGTGLRGGWFSLPEAGYFGQMAKAAEVAELPVDL